MHRHLCRAVKYGIGNTAAYKLRTAPVLNDECVNSALRSVLYIFAELFGFFIGNDSIYCKIKLCTVSVAEPCGFGYFLR